jgi:hypothetical protein
MSGSYHPLYKDALKMTMTGIARYLLVDHQGANNDGNTADRALLDCIVLLIEVGNEGGAVMTPIRL